MSAVVESIEGVTPSTYPPPSYADQRRRSSARMSKSLTNPFEHVWNTRVDELLDFERQYIGDMEILQVISAILLLY